MTITFGDTERVAHDEQTLVVCLQSDPEGVWQLVAELTAKLDFPYKPRNWNAFEDWLTDLSWLEERKVCLVHTGFPTPRCKADLIDQAVYLKILARVQHASGGQTVVAMFPDVFRSLIDDRLSRLEK